MSSSCSLAFTVIFIFFQLVNSVSANTSNVAKVEVSLYYDCLHNESAIFMSKEFMPALLKQNLTDVANVHFNPYGKAKIDGRKNQVICERGVVECYINRVQSCAIKIFPQDLSSSIIYGMEWYIVASGHARSFNTMEDPSMYSLARCVAGSEGKKLELVYTAKNSRLIPKIRTLPWLTINGQPLYNEYRDFKKIICKEYNGGWSRFCGQKTSGGGKNTGGGK